MRKMENKQPLSEMLRESLQNIRDMVSANTVIGDPINVVGGTVIIPVSKVSMGAATGGAEYNGKRETLPANFGGGGGTGLTVTPVAFLVVTSDGEARLLNVGENSGYDNSIVGAVAQVDDILEKTPDIIAKIKAIFKKDSLVKEKNGDDEGETAGKD